MLTKTPFIFYPIAIETSGVFDPDAYTILCDLARRIKVTVHPMNQTQMLPCSNRFLLLCSEAMLCRFRDVRV